MLESVFLARCQFSLPLPGFDYDHKELMSRYSHYALLGSLLQAVGATTVFLGGPLRAFLQYQLTEADAQIMIEGMTSPANVLHTASATRRITSHRPQAV